MDTRFTTWTEITGTASAPPKRRSGDRLNTPTQVPRVHRRPEVRQVDNAHVTSGKRFCRVVWSVVTAAMDVIVMVGLVVEVGQPAQRAETGQEAVLAAASDDKTLDAVQATPDRSLRDCKAAGAVVVAHE